MTKLSVQAKLHPRQQSGFSLVEIMVGLVIGMLATVIMLQMLSRADENKRTTVGGNDAQMNAAIAMRNLEREIRMAGHGMSDSTLLGCTLTFKPSGESANVTIQAIAPAVINPATSQIPSGDANTDTLLVMYSNTNAATEGTVITNATTATKYTVTTPANFAVGDFVIASSNTRPTAPNCALRLSQVTAVSGFDLTISNGENALPIGSLVYNLGKSPAIRAYAIRKGTLTVCDYTQKNCGNSSYATTPDSSVWVPVASNIVSLRAQYGRDNSATTPMPKVITQWDQLNPPLETDSNAATANPSIQCARARMLALRMVMVGRSNNYDKELEADGGLPTPTWSGSTGAAINLSQSMDSTSTWKGYRYKALETTIPLRNMIWRGGDTEC